MTGFKNALAAGISLIVITASAQKAACIRPVKIKPQRSVSLKVAEPSDICFYAATGNFFIASDDGALAEIDRDGKLLREVPAKGSDFEAVCTDGQKIYAVDETHRNIYIYDPATLESSQVINLPYSGARNKGYEAMAFNSDKKSFVLLTEKDPLYLFELDGNLTITNKRDLSGIARDISAATFYNHALWLLSDEDMMLMKLDPATYKVQAKWSLPVINPEGFAFDAEGNLLVTCDDMQRLYYFNNPEKQ